MKCRLKGGLCGGSKFRVLRRACSLFSQLCGIGRSGKDVNVGKKRKSGAPSKAMIFGEGADVCLKKRASFSVSKRSL